MAAEIKIFFHFLYMRLVIVDEHELKPSIFGGFCFFYFAIFDGGKKKPFSIHLNDYILSHRCAFLKRIFSAAKRTSLAHELKMQRHPLKGDFFILIFFLELCPLLRLSECLCFLASVGVLLFTIWTQRY